ncbi:hypothetical protein MWN33_15470 [Starkeya koreensis]|uniref:Uncharacterized protein n=1 Tax=Ancylobacter koreensis TaxID=266121 RepID=A0ABT0DQ83_9HYPH|nr:hypothetical protein [Ancylobacter koreensis]MCK0209433.1 hypothetical protein [Ancylobacter koreensis]
MARLAILLTAALLAPALAAAPARAAEPAGRVNVHVTALAPAVAFGQPARLPTADEHALGAAQAGTRDTGSGLELPAQQMLVGAALLGGAFALGLAATGSLSTALGAAGAVVIGYAVLP